MARTRLCDPSSVASPAPHEQQHSASQNQLRDQARKRALQQFLGTPPAPANSACAPGRREPTVRPTSAGRVSRLPDTNFSTHMRDARHGLSDAVRRAAAQPVFAHSHEGDISAPAATTPTSREERWKEAFRKFHRQRPPHSPSSQRAQVSATPPHDGAPPGSWAAARPLLRPRPASPAPFLAATAPHAARAHDKVNAAAVATPARAAAKGSAARAGVGRADSGRGHSSWCADSDATRQLARDDAAKHPLLRGDTASQLFGVVPGPLGDSRRQPPGGQPGDPSRRGGSRRRPPAEATIVNRSTDSGNTSSRKQRRHFRSAWGISPEEAGAPLFLV